MYFTYFLRWSNIDRMYYGCRYSKTAHPSQLWTKYFTSSKAVKEIRSLYGDPDVIQVRRTFKTKHDCLVWEHKFLKRVKARESIRWLNVTEGSLFANTKHKVVVKDRHTGVVVGAVEQDHPLYVSGDYIYHLTGVSKGPSKLKGQIRPSLKNMVLAVDPNTLEYFKVPKSDVRIKTGALVPWLKLFCHAKDPLTGVVCSVQRNDPRLLTGELVCITSKKVPVKDPHNPNFRLSVDKDDPRLVSGELVHVRKGHKQKDPSYASRPKEKNGRWSGISDQEYIDKIIEIIEQTNNTLRWKQICDHVKLPASRGHIRAIIEQKFALPTYR